MQLSILFAVFTILFHGVASTTVAANSEKLNDSQKQDAAFESFRKGHGYRIQAQARGTDPKEAKRLEALAVKHELAAHSHLDGLDKKETKHVHRYKAKQHKAAEQF